MNPKKSGELGRDIISDPNSAGAHLFGETKYALEGVEELDGVLSKWQEVQHQLTPPGDDTLFPVEFNEDLQPRFVLIAAVSLSGIVKRFEGQRRSSRQFYDELRDGNRLYIFDLDAIYKWLRESYIRQHAIPSTFELVAPQAWSNLGAVYLGAVSGPDIVDLVDEHGEAMFFENIRGWLGDEGQK